MFDFTTRPLTAEQKRNLNLPIGGFASEVVDTLPRFGPPRPPLPMTKDEEAAMKEAWARKTGAKSDMPPMLKPGDIITGVEGVQESVLTQNVEHYIRLTKKAGDSITLDLLRDGKTTQIKQNSYRQFYRKSDPSRDNEIPRRIKPKRKSYRPIYRESNPSRNK
jgi:hypothetical protein